MNKELRLENQKILGQYIKELRTTKKLTQKEVGELLGKKESTVRMWELGKSVPPADSIQKICELFDGDYFSLMGLAGHYVHPSQIIEDEQININSNVIKQLEKKFESNLDINESNIKIALKEGIEKDSDYFNALRNDYNYYLHFLSKIKEKRENDFSVVLQTFKEKIIINDKLTISKKNLTKETKDFIVESLDHILKQAERMNQK